MSNIKQLCWNCKYWMNHDMKYDAVKASWEKAQCRKGAPIPVPFGEYVAKPLWPSTSGDDWCGDYEQRAGSECIVEDEA